MMPVCSRGSDSSSRVMMTKTRPVTGTSRPRFCDAGRGGFGEEHVEFERRLCWCACTSSDNKQKRNDDTEPSPTIILCHGNLRVYFMREGLYSSSSWASNLRPLRSE